MARALVGGEAPPGRAVRGHVQDRGPMGPGAARPASPCSLRTARPERRGPEDRARYDMSPDEYRRRWGLQADYPMVAPAYAARRSDFAKQIGLGRGVRRRK